MAYEILEYFDEPSKVQSMQQPQEETLPQWAGRNVARAGSRVAETIGSIPETSYGLLKSASEMVPESVKSGLSNAFPLASLGAQAFSKIGEQLPSQEGIRKGISNIAPEGYLEPKTENEQLTDEIVSDIASLVVPLGPLGGVKPLKALGIAGISNAASYLTKSIGGSEKSQKGVKLGTMLLTSLGMGSSLKDKAKQLYETARESIAPGEKISAVPIQKALNKITKDYTSKGLSKSAGKVDVDRVVGEIDSFIHNDSIGLEDLWAIKKDMNEVVQKIGYGTKGGRELKSLENEINTALKSSSNKQFSSALSAADQLYGGVSRANEINEYVKGLVNNKVFGGTALLAILHNPAAAIPTIGKLAAGGSLMLGGKHGKEILSNMLKSPAIRNEYAAMMNAAAKQSAPSVIKHAKKLNKNLEKIESKQKDRYEILEMF